MLLWSIFRNFPNLRFWINEDLRMLGNYSIILCEWLPSEEQGKHFAFQLLKWVFWINVCKSNLGKFYSDKKKSKTNINPIIFQLNIPSELWDQLRSADSPFLSRMGFIFDSPSLHGEVIPYLSIYYWDWNSLSLTKGSIYLIYFPNQSSHLILPFS